LRNTPIIFAENWQKSQNIVIITSTHDPIILLLLNLKLQRQCYIIGSSVF
jgi:hypothetical protein